MVTPTQLIRMAALKTGSVPVPGGVVKYEDVAAVPVPDARCWLCGGETGGLGIPAAGLIRPTFTNRDSARRPESRSLCAGCAFCLSHPSLRSRSILAHARGLAHPSRAEAREALLLPPEPPFVFCVAVSGKKHLHFRARVAWSRDRYPVQFEDLAVEVDREVLACILSDVDLLLRAFGKEEVRTGRYRGQPPKGADLKALAVAEERLSRFRGSRLFKLAVHVA